jgi:hypothetical protein
MKFIIILLSILNLINCKNENLFAIPDSISLRINENLLINTEYFLSTIYYKQNTIDFKLMYLFDTKFNCSNIDKLVDSVNEFDINIKNFAHNPTETIDKVYLVIKTKLDYEVRTKYTLCLVSNDDAKTSVLTIKVDIQDLNDNEPVFEKNEYEISILEGLAVPIELDLNIKATDKDSNSTITYSLVSDDDFSTIPFEINPRTGRIRCVKVLDREFKSLYKLKLIANDNNPLKPLVGYAKLSIKVLDVNDNKPIVKFLFADSLLEYDFTDLLNQLTLLNQTILNETEETKISENTLEGSFICYIVVVDLDSRENTLIDVKNVDGSGKEYFKLDKVDFDTTLFQFPTADLVPVLNLYTLTLAHELDREINDRYELVISINDNNQTFIERKLSVIVTDSNDNEPKFVRMDYEFSIYDDNHTDLCIGAVEAYDPDLGLNGTIEYYLVNATSSCNHSVPFILNKTSGQICVSDKIMCLKYELTVQAKDHGLQPLISKVDASVVITKRFLSDNKPIFFQHELNRPFNFNRYSLAGSYIGWVKAYTLDYGVNSMIEYRIEAKNTNDSNLNEQLSALFSVDSDGYLRNMMELSELQINEIQLNIIASNIELPSLINELNVTVKLTNETSDGILIPNQSVLYITSNQVDFLQKNQNLSFFKFGYENTEQFMVYKISYLDDKCKNMFEISGNGNLFVKNFTNLIIDDICYLNISIIDNLKVSYIDLIIVMSNNSNNNTSDILFRRTKSDKNFLSIDFNQLLIIFIIFVFSLLLTILICLIILMRCRNNQKIQQKGDDGLFVHTEAKSTSPALSSSSSIENTSSTNSKLTEIESIESLKINNDFSKTTTTTKSTIWLGNPVNDSTKQINEVCC